MICCLLFLNMTKAIKDRDEWVRDFHVIDRPSNEVFELRKSGIAETKLMPLKDRLARFAAISVREQKPDPFCVEKKATDLLVANGKPAREVPQGFDKTVNPYYDATVEEDLRIIQRHSEAREQKHQKKLRKKLLRAALQSIPSVDYHPDRIVIAQAAQSELQQSTSQPQLQQQELLQQHTGGFLDMSSSVEMGRGGSVSLGPSPAKKKVPLKKTLSGPFAAYEATLSPNKIKGNSTKTKKKSGSGSTMKMGRGNRDDNVYTHVMQPFDKYLRREEEEAERLRVAEEAHRQNEEARRWQGDSEEGEDEIGSSELDRLGLEFNGEVGSSSVYQTSDVDHDLMFDEDAALEMAGERFDSHDRLVNEDGEAEEDEQDDFKD